MMLVFLNATIKGTRGNPAAIIATGYAVRRVQWIWPTPQDALGPEGQIITARFYDTPSSAWHQGDLVTVVSFDGVPALPEPFTAEIMTVHAKPSPLPLLEIVLKGADT